MSTVEEIQPSAAQHHPHAIHVRVDYLPAASPFHHAYAPETTVETVRIEAMAFFGARDRQERDTYRYFLELGGVRIIDTNQSLGEVGTRQPDKHDLHFNLVEEITPGS